MDRLGAAGLRYRDDLVDPQVTVAGRVATDRIGLVGTGVGRAAVEVGLVPVVGPRPGPEGKLGKSPMAAGHVACS